MVIFATLVQHQ